MGCLQHGLVHIVDEKWGCGTIAARRIYVRVDLSCALESCTEVGGVSEGGCGAAAGVYVCVCVDKMGSRVG